MNLKNFGLTLFSKDFRFLVKYPIFAIDKNDVLQYDTN